MRRRSGATRVALPVLVLLAGACSAGTSDPNPTATRTAPPTTASSTTTPESTTIDTTSTTAAATTSTTTTTTSPPPPSPSKVAAPGTYTADDLVILLRFVSEVDDVPSAAFEAAALATLNDPAGWTQSGFRFVADEASELMVVLTEGPRVDALCLPLETYGKVSCQNGAVVALNADRWRIGADDWDSSVDAYRTYLVNHEVGHLIGLRHPLERCPTADMISALMEPQTNNLQGCRGNGIPLAWEVEWARNRPVVIGPDPDWDGPRPSWPDG